MTDPNAPAAGQPQPGQSEPPASPPPLPPMGPVTTQFARVDPGPSQKFGLPSFLVTLVGTALCVVAFTGVNWFDGSDSGFSRVHKLINSAVAAGIGSPPVARAYFGWLAWVLLGVTVVLALLAATPTVGGGPFRVAGAAMAVAAVVVSFLAIKVFKDAALLNTAYHGYWSYLKHARFGFYLAVAGFVLIGVGAAIGPAQER